MVSFRDLNLGRLCQLKEAHSKWLTDSKDDMYKFSYHLNVLIEVNKEMYRRYGYIF